MEHVHLAGYDYANVQRSPVTLADLNLLKASVGFTDRDREALRRAGDLANLLGQMPGAPASHGRQ